MSTNYYLHAPACPHCKIPLEEPLHLGKSSQGWCFSLHLYPEDELSDWADIWERLEHSVVSAGYEIKTEYGESVNLSLFFATVWDRSNNCKRHDIDDRCIGHGLGPFDYFIGDFS